MRRRLTRSHLSSCCTKLAILVLAVVGLWWVMSSMGFGGISSPAATTPHINLHTPTATTKENGDMTAVVVTGSGDASILVSESSGGGSNYGNQFTIVMLSYKSPLSLSATLRSLVESGVTSHPNFKEVLVYFQVRRSGGEDDAIVASILGVAGIKFTVVGDGRNLPVAQATAEAVRQATTPLILYLECDRPVFPFGHKGYRNALSLTQISTIRTRVAAQLSLASRYVVEGDAHVFRLQLYSSEEALSDVSISSLLPKNTYGTDPHRHCQNTPYYHRPPPLPKGDVDVVVTPVPNSGVCLNDKRTIKASHGHEFYTAYCKHWTKLQIKEGSAAKPQSDMCDSFCFLEWAIMDHNNGGPNTASASIYSTVNSRIRGRNVSTSEEGVVCLTSEDCNWTNQPTMYARSWFLGNIAKPCFENPTACVGKPGRMSAVRQEQFYLKFPDFWARRKYKVCLSSGVFYHNEVDNRE